MPIFSDFKLDFRLRNQFFPIDQFLINYFKDMRQLAKPGHKPLYRIEEQNWSEPKNNINN